MKKILVVFDGKNFSEGALNFAIQLQQLSPCLVVGVVLNTLNRSLVNLGHYDMQGYVADMVETEADTIVDNIRRFKTLCKEHNMMCIVHNDAGADAPLNELVKESRFADLLVIGSEVFYKELGSAAVNVNLKFVLHETECPIILVPENFNFPESVALTYDGSASSVFAIKSFTSLFPALRDKPALLVYANEKKEELPHKEYIEELIGSSYKNLTIQRLGVNPAKYFGIWAKSLKKPIIVAGSYSRPGISELFHKNFLSEAIADHKYPVFIAHK